MDTKTNLTKAHNLVSKFQDEKREELLFKIEDETKIIDNLDVKLEQYKNLLRKKEITEDDQRLLYNGYTSKELSEIWDIAQKLKGLTEIIQILQTTLIMCAILCSSILYIIDEPIINSASIIFAVLITFLVILYSLKIKERSKIYNRIESMVDDNLIQLPIDEDRYKNENKYRSKIIIKILKRYVIQNNHTSEQKQLDLMEPYYEFHIPDHKEILKHQYRDTLALKNESLLTLQSLLDKLSKVYDTNKN